MRAVVVEKPGGPSSLKMMEIDDPQLEEDQVLIRVAATAVNRLDFLCRSYPIRPDCKTCGVFCPGLECSGVIKAVGAKVNSQWKIGDKVCAVLKRGGYAEEVAVSAKFVLPVPSNVSLTYAASLPEAACDAARIMHMADFEPGKRVLIHACSGYSGLVILQMAKCKGAVVYVTAVSDAKLEFYKRLGADVGINLKNEGFVARVKENTGGEGVHVVVDSWAGHLEKNIEILSYGGKIFYLDLQGSALGKINFASLMARQGKIQVLDRWTLTVERKAAVLDFVKKEIWPQIENGLVQPVVYKTFQLSEAATAHKFTERTNKYKNLFSFFGSFFSWLECYTYTHNIAGHVMGKVLLTLEPEES